MMKRSFLLGLSVAIPAIGVSAFLAVPALSQSQFGLEDLEPMVRAEEGATGSFLPLPATGLPGVLTEADDAFSLTYNGLNLMGLELVDLDFALRPLGDGQLEIDLVSYNLSEPMQGLWDAFAPEGTLPKFSGVWNMDAGTYNSFSLEMPVNLRPEVDLQITGDLQIQGTSGPGGALLIRLADMALDPGIEGEGMDLERAQIRLGSVGESLFDPYAVLNGASEVAQTLQIAPAAALGLLPAYSNVLLGNEVALSVDASGFNLRADTATGTLETASFDLQKTGADMTGAQGLRLTLGAQDGQFKTENYFGDVQDYAFEAVSLDQSLSLTDVFGAIGNSTRLSILAQTMESPQSMANFVDAVGEAIDDLNFRLETNASVAGLRQNNLEESYDGDLLGQNMGLSSASFDLVLDLEDQISIALSASGADGDFNTGWDQTRFSLADASYSTVFDLWDGMPTDVAASLSQMLQIGGGFGPVFDRGLTPGMMMPLGGIGAMGLSNVLAYGGQTQASVNDLYVGNNNGYSATFFKLDEGSYLIGPSPREGGARFNLDGLVESLAVVRQFSEGEELPFIDASQLAILQEAEDPSLWMSLDRASHDINLDTAPFGPYWDLMLQLAGQAVSIEGQEFADYKPLLREAALATLNLFEGTVYAVDVAGLNLPEHQGEYSWEYRPHISLDQANFNFAWDRQSDQVLALGLTGFDYQNPQAFELPQVSLGEALIESTGPAYPMGFGEQLVDFYIDMIDTLAVAGTGPSWGDYARAIAYDYSSTATAAVRDLNVVAMADDLSFGLEGLTMQAASTLTEQPLTYDTDYTLSWTGLAAQASSRDAEAFLAVIIPSEAGLDLSVRLGVSPEGLAILDGLSMIDTGFDQVQTLRDQASALSALDVQVSIPALTLGSSAWNLEGAADLFPQMSANPDAIQSRWQTPLDALAIRPNLQASATLTGLGRLKASADKILKGKGLGPLEFIQDMAAGVAAVSGFLEAFGQAGPGPDSLSYEITMPELDQLEINGLALP